MTTSLIEIWYIRHHIKISHKLLQIMAVINYCVTGYIFHFANTCIYYKSDLEISKGNTVTSCYIQLWMISCSLILSITCTLYHFRGKSVAQEYFLYKALQRTVLARKLTVYYFFPLSSVTTLFVSLFILCLSISLIYEGLMISLSRPRLSQISYILP